MRKIALVAAFIFLQIINTANAQTIESLIEELPTYFSILTTWGVRPEWDEKSENIYFLNKLVGDVF